MGKLPLTDQASNRRTAPENLNFTREQKRRYFQSRLTGQQIGAGPQVYAKCPFHDDRRASMSLNFKEGIWKCHAAACPGNKGGGLLAFERMLTNCNRQAAWNSIHKAMGLEKPRPQPDGADYGETEAVYPYVDRKGRLSYEKLRFPGKRFKVRRPDGKGGHIWNLDGIQLLLYNLPAVLKARAVFITEGEKDADRLSALFNERMSAEKRHRFAATTNSGGAAQWNAADGKLLEGKRVYVLEDNDDAGRERSEIVPPSVYPWAKKVKVLRLPGLRPKGDVSDWLLKHTASEFFAVLNKTEKWHPEAENAARQEGVVYPDLVCLADVPPSAVTWLWKPYIPLGMLTMVSGDPGVGKTFIGYSIAAELTRGRCLNGSSCRRENVVCLTVENAAAEVVRPRFEMLGGDVKRFFLLAGTVQVNDGKEQRGTITLHDIALLDETLATTGARLVIVDPIQSYFGAKVDMHRSNETRPLLDGLAKLAEKYDCAILLLRHVSKQSGGRAIHRGLGSIDLTGAVRSELLAGSLPDDPGSRALVHIKSNVGPYGPSIAYEIDDEGRFRWLEGTCDITAAQLLETPRRTAGGSALARAMEWLRSALAAGSRPSVEIQTSAKAGGISMATLRRAKDELGVKSQKAAMDDGWDWALPTDGTDGDQDG
jgi:putative DNA primase/helicase